MKGLGGCEIIAACGVPPILRSMAMRAREEVRREIEEKKSDLRTWRKSGPPFLQRKQGSDQAVGGGDVLTV